MPPARLPSDAYARLWFLFRYAIVGITGAVIQTLVLYAWVSVLGFYEHYLLGVVVGFCIALAATFTLQKFWTFRDRSMHRTSRQFSVYTGIALGSLGLNMLLLVGARRLLEALQLDFFHGWYLAAQVVIIVFLAGVSFVLNALITFSEADETSR